MDNNKLDKNEMLSRISEAVRRKQEGENPDVLRRVKALMGGDTTGLDITPPKPDPEAAANAQIERAVRAPSVIREAEIVPGRSPSVVTEDEIALDPEAAQEAERRQIRMQLLQEAAKSGQLPSYLK